MEDGEGSEEAMAIWRTEQPEVRSRVTTEEETVHSYPG